MYTTPIPVSTENITIKPKNDMCVGVYITTITKKLVVQVFQPFCEEVCWFYAGILEVDAHLLIFTIHIALDSQFSVKL